MHIKHKLSLLFIDQSVVSVLWLGPCLTDLSVDQCPSRPLTSVVFFLFWSTVRANAEPSVCLPLCPQLHRGPRVQGTQCCEATRD